MILKDKYTWKRERVVSLPKSSSCFRLSYFIAFDSLINSSRLFVLSVPSFVREMKILCLLNG
jgi:hypothetical protein